MEERKEVLKRIFEKYLENDSRVQIISVKNFVYTASISQVLENCVIFLDKFGNEVFLDFDEIKSVGGFPR